ncbi:MAG TPA: sugar ABC transporter substrate-binding protein [Bacillus bacterium]|nr:sugar ABC transporter substrate-binding protein [Bacillus sp. (in: firmicutes)]
MRKYAWFIITSLLLSLVSCSAENTAKRANEKNGSNHESLPEIKVIGDGPNTMALFKMEEEEIAKRFGVRLSYNYPERITENLEQFLFATEEKYDIYILFPVKIPLYVERDMLLPLDSYISEEHVSDMLPVFRNMFMKYDGHDYGMVYDGDTHLLFYRKDIFEKYNNEYKKQFGIELQAPKTWEEHDQIAKFLTRDFERDGKIDLHGTAILNGEGMRYIWFAERFLSLGGAYFDSNMKPLVNSDIGIRALSDLVELANSNVIPDAMLDWTDLNNVFLQGKVAMIVQWSDTARFSYDENAWKSKVAGKVDWALLPSGLPNAPRGGSFLGRVLAISKNSKNPDKVWEIIEYLTSKEVSKRAINSYETGTEPYRESHFVAEGKGPFSSEKENKHFLATSYDSFKNTNIDLIIPGSWDYMQSLDHNMGLALIGKLTPAEALDKTAEEWEMITNKYGIETQKKHYEDWLQRFEEVRQ